MGGGGAGHAQLPSAQRDADEAAVVNMVDGQVLADAALRPTLGPPSGRGLGLPYDGANGDDGEYGSALGVWLLGLYVG